MEVQGLRLYPNTGEGSIDLSKIATFLSQFQHSPHSGRIFFKVKESVLSNGDREQRFVIKKDSYGLLQ